MIKKNLIETTMTRTQSKLAPIADHQVCVIACRFAKTVSVIISSNSSAVLSSDHIGRCNSRPQTENSGVQ